MDTRLFTGKLVRLCSMDLEHDIDAWARWSQDSEYQQLSDWGPSNLHTKKQMREWVEKDSQNSYTFFIHTLDNDCLIGDLGLGGINWTARDAWLGVGIGEREYWGKGYGTDAIAILLRFAFMQLNLNRISLDVFGYNERAIRSYEKLGFQHEGRMRQLINRFDQRWDMIYMGLLRSEWEERQSSA